MLYWRQIWAYMQAVYFVLILITIQAGTTYVIVN
jgi:hypothetical protein